MYFKLKLNLINKFINLVSEDLVDMTISVLYKTDNKDI